MKKIFFSFFSLLPFWGNAQYLFEAAFGKIGATSQSYAVIPVTNGYLLAGMSTIPALGNGDMHLLKIGISGNNVWTRGFGGTNYEEAQDVIRTSNGGFALIGTTLTYGNGTNSIFLVRTDSFGNSQWKYTYGGVNYSTGKKIIQTADGGYLICGTVNETFGLGNYDIWLIKTDSVGVMQWNKTYGDTGADVGYDLILVNGGYVVAGTVSYGAAYDMFMMKVDTGGNPLWSRTFGGNGWDIAYGVVQMQDGGFALGGYTDSYGAGNRDIYLVRTDTAGNMIWNKTYGTNTKDECRSIKRTPDGGLILAGESYSFGSFADAEAMLLKTDSLGNYQWVRSYGGTSDDFAYDLAITNDGGFIFTGETYSFGPGPTNLFVVKTDSNGYTPCNSLVQFVLSDSGGVQGSGVLTTNGGGSRSTGGQMSTLSTTGFLLCSNLAVSDNFSQNTGPFFFPNPFSSETNLKNFKNCELLEIFDLSGKMVGSFSLSGSGFTLKSRGLAPGAYLYFISEKNNLQVTSGKLIVVPEY